MGSDQQGKSKAHLDTMYVYYRNIHNVKGSAWLSYVKALWKARRFHQRFQRIGQRKYFTVYLPYHSETTPNNMQQKKLKILLVEDDTNLGTLLRKYSKRKAIAPCSVNGNRALTCSQRIKFNIASGCDDARENGLHTGKEIRAIDTNVHCFPDAKSMKEDTMKVQCRCG